MPLKFEENKKLTNELTLVFLRGNGVPKTLRLQIPELKRFIIVLSALFGILLIVSFVLAGAYLYQKNILRNSMNTTASSLPAVVENAPSISPSFSSTKGENDAKEASGLREDISKLHIELEKRKTISGEVNDNIVLQMMSAKSTFVPDIDAFMKVKNPRIKRNPSTKDLSLDFELHNIDPKQQQIRGYIVVLAKNPNMLFAYPPGVLSPQENVLLRFTKGETFAVSRFREAQAIFKNLPTEITHFQIILFNTLGKVLASLQVEEK